MYGKYARLKADLRGKKYRNVHGIRDHPVSRIL
jgi:hypothetical protein